jgi:hypothetical protein
MIRKTVILFALWWISFSAFSQELNCKVSVISPQIQSSDKSVFKTLETAIFEFMNNRVWTNDQFKIEERIECNILINIQEWPSIDQMKGSIQIQYSRPVFNAGYNSPILSLTDKDFNIRYIENNPIQYSPDQFRDNLSSILAYYAYIILGFDYDTYSLEGGNPFLIQAQRIVNNAQNAGESGWKAFDGTQNRYWIVENHLHQSFKPLRKCLYEYHRNGFDTMNEDIKTGRSNVLTSLEGLEKVHQLKPGSYNLQLFFIAKSDELVNLFSQGLPDEKSRIVPLLKRLDPGNISKYQKILTNKK